MGERTNVDDVIGSACSAADADSAEVVAALREVGDDASEDAIGAALDRRLRDGRLVRAGDAAVVA